MLVLRYCCLVSLVRAVALFVLFDSLCYLCSLYEFPPIRNLFFVWIVEYGNFLILELQFATACAKVSSRSAGYYLVG